MTYSFRCVRIAVILCSCWFKSLQNKLQSGKETFLQEIVGFNTARYAVYITESHFSL